MIWKKLGLVWSNPGDMGWNNNSALTPTPFILNDHVVRVYAGFRDLSGVSRIGYVDLDAKDPTRVLDVSKQPALNIGRDGCFDDNGVILGDVVRNGPEIYMYYVGFQLVKKAKFLAFTGLAISHDGGDSFKRHAEVPVLDRAAGASTINALHSIRRSQRGWCAYVAQGDGWEIRSGVSFPRYEIFRLSSADGVHFDNCGEKVIACHGDEYRIGRPSVFERPDGGLGMFYTAGFRSSDRYDAGLALSSDGAIWRRADGEVGLVLGEGDDFDSKHLCYPRIFNGQTGYFAVYNGNNMGVEGFGLAELVSW